MPPPRSPWVWLPPATGLALLALILASGANQPVFLALNHAGQGIGPRFWLHFTMLGDGAVALALMLPFIRRSPQCFWGALVAALFVALWTQLPKQFIDLPRPLAALPHDQFFQAGPTYRRVSFPSGHAATAFAIAGIWIMGVARSRLLRASLLLLATMVGLSRVMVGVHWPVDILWGMVGGWLGAWIGLALQARWRWRTSGAAGIGIGLLLLALPASLLVSHHLRIPEVMTMQRLIGGVCLVWAAWEIWQMLPWRRRAPAPGSRRDIEEKADG